MPPEYYRKHKPRENVSPLDDVEDQLYDPEVDRWFRYAELVADAERLRAQLTEKENEILALCLKMSRNMAAKELHCSESNINNAIKRITRRHCLLKWRRKTMCSFDYHFHRAMEYEGSWPATTI